MSEFEPHDPFAFTILFAVTILAAVATLAGYVRGLTGYGGPAVIILVLAPFFSPACVVREVLLSDFGAGCKMVPAAADDMAARLCAVLVLGTVGALALDLYAVITVDPEIMRRVVAGVAGGFRLRAVPLLPVAFAAGFGAGCITGATLIAFPMMAYLLALPVAAARSRANGVWWGFLVTFVLLEKSGNANYRRESRCCWRASNPARSHSRLLLDPKCRS
ncbi:MAG: hypothetical protein GKR94_16580 [Gammaproteobacteria bacterium]|nr:hypothetical protein [Gammaproteobacteria bacterium]